MSGSLKKIQPVQTLQAAEENGHCFEIGKAAECRKESVIGKLIANDRHAVYHSLRIIL